MRDSLNTLVIFLTVFFSIGMLAPALSAKSMDPLLNQAIQKNSPNHLHQVIVTFNTHSAPSESQINGLDQIGVTGISFKQLPIAGVLATSSQIEEIYQRDDVVSVWLNAELSLENKQSKQLTGVDRLAQDSNMRINGVPYSGKGIGVVINDSGVDGMHGDIKYPDHTIQNVFAQTNLNSFAGVLPISYQENIVNTDIAGGHGSHVAGIIGSNGAMSNGYHAGVAPGASIIGYGSGAGLFILDTLGGFDYALTHQYNYNIRVISNSFGNTSDVGTDFNPEHPTNIATKKLADRGVIVVFSAGNSGSGESTITGNFKKAPWVITVAAGDKKGKLAAFSSRGEKGRAGTVTLDGAEYQWSDEPTITAPGVDIISVRASLSSLSALSIGDDSEVIEPKHLPYYTVMSGTSMAAPHVSGVVALMLEANPNLNWKEVKNIIQQTATNMPANEPWESGAGYINAYAAVKAARDGVAPFGATTKKNRDFNAMVNQVVAREWTENVAYNPVVDEEPNTFKVAVDVSMIVLKTQISNNSLALVLEDPVGNTYSSGIALPVLGERKSITAPAMPGEWKLYARGIGSVSGNDVDPTGQTNGYGLPAKVEANLKLIRTTGYKGIDDTDGHPAQRYIEYVVANQLMDATEAGFQPNHIATKFDLSDALVLSGGIRQHIDGNVPTFEDINQYFGATNNTASGSSQHSESESVATQAPQNSIYRSAVFNAVSQKGAALRDRQQQQLAVVPAITANIFGPQDPVSKISAVYSIVQCLGLQSIAQQHIADEEIKFWALEQWIPIADIALIDANMRGYAKLALDLGIVVPRIVSEQGMFDPAPVLQGYLEPNIELTRAELATLVTRFHQVNQ